MAPLTNDEWVRIFVQDVVRALAPFTGSRVCSRLSIRVQETLDMLLVHNLTNLITIRCANWYEVRVPGSFELVGRVNPWKVVITSEGVQVPWESEPEAVHASS